MWTDVAPKMFVSSLCQDRECKPMVTKDAAASGDIFVSFSVSLFLKQDFVYEGNSVLIDVLLETP